MKKVLDFMMNNKYFIIVFAVIVFSLRVLLERFAVPEKYLSLITSLKVVFLVVFAICFVHVVSFFVFALATRNKSEAWWENLENKHQPETDKYLKPYIQGLIISIPLAVYGSLVYLAAFASWQSIFIFVITFVITRLINYFQNRRKSSLHRDV